MKLLIVIISSFCLVDKGTCALKPRIYYLESECDKAFGNKASTYIGIDEQVRILTSLNATYASSFSCSYTLRSKPGDRMMFYFKDLHMEDSNCLKDWLTFNDGDENYLGFIGNNRYCGEIKPVDVFVSSGHELTIYFRSDAFLEKEGFDIVVTVFHDGSCALFESKCSNGRCIHGDLNCNGYNPCGDFSDCDGDRSEGSYLGIIIGSCSAVFTFTVVIVFIVVFIKCKRRRSPGQQGHVVPTALLVGGLGIDKDKGSTYIVYNERFPQSQGFQRPAETRVTDDVIDKREPASEGQVNLTFPTAPVTYNTINNGY